MSEKLDVIILDDEPLVCTAIADLLEGFYVWGDIHPFTDFDKALSFCKKKKRGVAIFILDVFLKKDTCFNFLDQIADQFPCASDDTIVITGNASDDIVNMCLASDITFLIEKPIKTYALQFAVRAIVGKYIRFTKRILGDPAFAKDVAKF